MSAEAATQLKVGELARSTGLTVRTLHHYDEIGLLKPSGRSESGYRLYSQSDVQRLHGIQALRHMGLSLADITAVFEGRGASPGMIIEQQMRALDVEIARATELRARLALMRGKFSRGAPPELDEWLKVLAEMATYGKYFNAAELKAILAGWARIKDQWAVLMRDVAQAMRKGVPAEAPEVQPLARRWMSLVLYWMGGNFDLIERWDQMYRQERYSIINGDGPPEEMVHYIRKAIDARLQVTLKHLSMQEISRFRHVSEDDWQALHEQVLSLLERGEPPEGEAGQATLARWQELIDRLCNGEQVLREKLLHAASVEPLLRAGSPLSPLAHAFVRRALEHAKSLDPHVA
jgi:DNA-binding transcriptional MerR regulator